MANEIAAKHGCQILGPIGSLEDHYLLEHSELPRYHDQPSINHVTKLKHESGLKYVEQQSLLRRDKRVLWTNLKDPLFSKMWYIHGQINLNVIAAWTAGWTGKGVVVTIIDDGLETDNPDIKGNYDRLASYDFNDNDTDPTPRYDEDFDDVNENAHGTRCAGEIASQANNTLCAVGMAPNARIGGLRLLDGELTDALEAAALSFEPQYVDIYSNSWGPVDNGVTIDGPKSLGMKALENGVLNGRGGKGSIYVWAAGNGGDYGDSCSIDGYVNSIYTIAITAVTSRGRKPWYTEECSAILATAFSSGNVANGDLQIPTIDILFTCTTNFTGTSAAVPQASGIIALVLEANGNLTWRDVQYIILLSAKSDQLDDGEWGVNGVGRRVSHIYGYGIMDANVMTTLAQNWTSVPKQRHCYFRKTPLLILKGPGGHIPIHTENFTVKNCSCKKELNYLEHVELRAIVVYGNLGDLGFVLTSPSGTKSTLLHKRKDVTNHGIFGTWAFMSVHFWGENPYGTWQLDVVNYGSHNNYGELRVVDLLLYGTSTDPLMTVTHKAMRDPDVENFCGIQSLPDFVYVAPINDGLVVGLVVGLVITILLSVGIFVVRYKHYWSTVANMPTDQNIYSIGDSTKSDL